MDNSFPTRKKSIYQVVQVQYTKHVIVLEYKSIAR